LRGRKFSENKGNGKTKKKRQQLLNGIKENKKILEIGKGSIRLHSVYVSLWRKLWTSRKTDYKINEIMNE